MKTKIVHVTRPIIPPDGLWHVYDERREHEEDFEPDAAVQPYNGWLREAMGGRLSCYFRAVWSIEFGWQFRQRLPGNYLW